MRIVDLFSGAGGLTFGFYYSLNNGRFVRNLDNKIIFANEYNKYAAEAFRLNFPDVNMIEKNVVNLAEKEIKSYIGNEQVDIIIGGPPCQSFSTVGKRTYDDRARLYEQYLRVLKIVRPRMFVFENVKGILSMKDGNNVPVMTNISKKFGCINNDLGYKIVYKVLDSVQFGVPQNRERVFIIGIRNDQNIVWNFPKGKNKSLTIAKAISDFPAIQQGEESTKYKQQPKNIYQKLMRSKEPLTYHKAAQHGEKILMVIKNVAQGEGHDDYNKKVEAGEIANGHLLTSGYANTYGRLWENRPCTTITHNMSTPSGLRCIHFAQNRALTPREGARIQSFPDWFKFAGPLTHVKTQIGNAVPPLLSIALCKAISQALNEGRI
jgi:DNA (cytosine-5)-methyltransferase 1